MVPSRFADHRRKTGLLCESEDALSCLDGVGLEAKPGVCTPSQSSTSSFRGELGLEMDGSSKFVPSKCWMSDAASENAIGATGRSLGKMFVVYSIDPNLVASERR